MAPAPLQLTREVIDGINEELAYTSTLPAQHRADKEDYGVEGQLITLFTYTHKALNAWTNNVGSKQALHELRKVAAVASRALIQHGCPKRGEQSKITCCRCGKQSGPGVGYCPDCIP